MSANRRCRPLLGTYVEICVDNDADDRSPAREDDQTDSINLAFQRIAKVQYLMSPHLQESDLCKINRLAKDRSLRLHPWTWRVLHKALEIHHRTQGAFDCAIRGTLSNIELADQNCIILKDSIHLDLGGIAKGFAVDQAIASLQGSGVRQALVNAGGDLRLYGNVPRLMTVRDPVQPARVIPAGYLTCGALATSGPYFSMRTEGEQTTCALMNPFTRLAICTPKSYSVLAPNCMEADALTKALAVHQNTEAAYFATYRAQALLN